MKIKSKIISAIIAGAVAVTSFGGVIPNVIPEIGQSVHISAEEASTATSGACGDENEFAVSADMDNDGKFETEVPINDEDEPAVTTATTPVTTTTTTTVITTATTLQTTTALSTSATEISYNGTPYGDTGLYYKKEDSDSDGKYEFISITDCDKSAVSVSIPEEIEGLPVRKIYGFTDCTKLESISIPDSVEEVNTLFYGSPLYYSQKGIKYADNWVIGCDDSVVDAVIKEGTVGIAENAFDWESGINVKSITVPNSMTVIQDYAFCGSPASKITIPEGVTELGYRALAFTNIESIKLPDSLEYITSSVFIGCSKLKNISFGNRLKRIGKSAFTNCESLSSIKIPDSVEYISFEVFDGTPLLNEQTGVKYADNWVIGCDSDTTAPLIKEGTRGIAGMAFDGCQKIKNIEIPDSVVSLCYAAFDNCTGLKKIVIPENVSLIDDSTFADCENLTDIIIENPDCKIGYDNSYGSSGVISNGHDEKWNYYFNGTIHGYKNSTAQKYAEKHGYKFEVLKDMPAVTTTAVTTVPSTTTTTVTTTTVTTTEPQTTEPAETTPVGDANGDNKLNVRDAAFIAAKLALGKSDELPECADFNGDGKINVRDAAAIAKFLASGKK